MLNFKDFQEAVIKRFDEIKNKPIYIADIDGDYLWDLYLESFPKEENKIFRERRYYECCCCRQFIRSAGRMVAVDESNKYTLWGDLDLPDNAFKVVANKLDEAIKSKGISDIYLGESKYVGTKFTPDTEDSSLIWNHFYLELPTHMIVKDTTTRNRKMTIIRDDINVFRRSIKEMSTEAIEVVLDLIQDNALIRGEQYKSSVNEFYNLKKEYEDLNLSDNEKELFFYFKCPSSPSVARIRGTSIGTLLVDLSGGRDLTESVNSFERKVAGENYQRPKPIVTKTMIENAKKTVEKLGFEESFKFRHASLDDISVNNVLFANSDARHIMKDNIFDEVIDEVSSKPNPNRNLKRIQEISMDKFINDIIPNSNKIEILFEKRHRNNLVNIFRNIDESAKNILKWNNNFTWSYNGDFADSIKEKVKRAGGVVDADVRFSLAWFNNDDLDLHLIEPNGNEIYFSNKKSSTGGELDVDMNVSGENSLDPVENIFYKSVSQLKEGEYRLFVDQYTKRNNSTADCGFEVECDLNGKVRHYTFNDILEADKSKNVIKFKYTKSKGFEILYEINNSNPRIAQEDIWSITTGVYQNINSIMYSPNYWDDQSGIGHRHVMFMIDKCKNPDYSRPFYNEYLNPQFKEHRKVFELIGSKSKVEPSDNQLCGLGFSASRRDYAIFRVHGKYRKEIKVNI